MIEKSFDKTYKFDVSKGVLTRTANRMIAEYVAANGGWSVPDEIKGLQFFNFPTLLLGGFSISKPGTGMV